MNSKAPSYATGDQVHIIRLINNEEITVHVDGFFGDMSYEPGGVMLYRFHEDNVTVKSTVFKPYHQIVEVTMHYV